MKTILLITLQLLCVAASDPETNESEFNKKLSDYFFALSTESDINSLKKELAANSAFITYEDPNRSGLTSIVGSIVQYKSINPESVRNQLIIQITPDGVRETVSYKLSVDYRLSDLPSAMHDWEQTKREFKPFFKEATEKTEIGYHQEEIQTLSLRKGNVTLNIRVVKFNTTNHTISLEYRNIRHAGVK